MDSGAIENGLPDRQHTMTRPEPQSPVQPRALHREWKKYKPVRSPSQSIISVSNLQPTNQQPQKHLPKSTSLPSLQLLPPNRPLFTCTICGFTNSQLIPLCLWCAWTNEEATREFEQSLGLCLVRSVGGRRGRGRRVSSPARVGGYADLAPVAVPAKVEVEMLDVGSCVSTDDAQSGPSLLEEESKRYRRSSKRHGMIAARPDLSVYVYVSSSF